MHLLQNRFYLKISLALLLVSLLSCGQGEPKERFVEGLQYEGPLPAAQPQSTIASVATPVKSEYNTPEPSAPTANGVIPFNGGRLEVQGTFSSYYRNVSVALGNYEANGKSEFGVALIENSTQKIIDLSAIDDGNPSSLYRLDSATPYIRKLPSGNIIAGYYDFGMRFGISNLSTAFVLLDDQNISKEATYISLSRINVDSADEGNEDTYGCNLHQTNFGRHEYFINVCENLDGSSTHRYEAFRVGAGKQLINLEEVKLEPSVSIDLSDQKSVLKYLRFFHHKLRKVDVEALIDLYAEEVSYYGKTNTDRVGANQIVAKLPMNGPFGG